MLFYCSCVVTAVLVRIHTSHTDGSMKKKSRDSTLFRKLYGYNTFTNHSRYNRRMKGLNYELQLVRFEGDLIMVGREVLHMDTNLVEEEGKQLKLQVA